MITHERENPKMNRGSSRLSTGNIHFKKSRPILRKSTLFSLIICLLGASPCAATSMQLKPHDIPLPPQKPSLLQNTNQLFTDEGDYQLKREAEKNLGLQWSVDMAYTLWHTENSFDDGGRSTNNFLLFRARIMQRIIEDNLNGGTWLRVDGSASQGLDSTNIQTEEDFIKSFQTGTRVHNDLVWPHSSVLSEFVVMHYMNYGRACISAGIVNQTNFFDAVSISNDSFFNFNNSGFVNSSVLPLVSNNLGLVLQMELDKKNYIMFSFAKNNTQAGTNPFHWARGYVLIGEWGHSQIDDKLIMRINPFFQALEGGSDGNNKTVYNAGITGSAEYAPCQRHSYFIRIGYGARQSLGPSGELSFGSNIKFFSSQPDDFLGIAYGFFKPISSSEIVNKHEEILEIMYSFQINDYIKIIPHIQFIRNPARNPSKKNQFLMSIQSVLSF